MAGYDHQTIEKKWQAAWDAEQTYRAVDDPARPKAYYLIEFPYPSGEGLHVGHPRSYTAMDVIARQARMAGRNVLYPIGFDAFGLPSENYAIKTGIHPAVTTAKNITTFTGQLKSLGLSFDWSRAFSTTDPAYYRWTQWIFLQLYKHGLAYKAKMPINWCVSCKIGLANEEVVGGRCERCGGPVEKREKEQWMLRITAYAERLLADLETVDYRADIKQQQVNWIGKSEGIDIRYDVEGLADTITVYTTRPDTNYGATFIVVAPESEFVQKHFESFKDKETVAQYIEEAKKKTDIERIAEGRKKTGVETGLYAINQLTGRKMPIYVSDFVLAHVGTGCVVGVPGHDVRDFEFAQEKGLEIVRVVVGADGDTSPITTVEQVQEEEGTMINSGFLDGMDIMAAKEAIKDHIEKNGWGKRVSNYKLRDWVFSRQRYWGEPIPMVWCEQCQWVPVPEDQLPVTLPEVEKYQPTDTGESPLAAMTDWVQTTCPQCGGAARRETDTMPNWAGSSWYFLRYTDPENVTAIADPDKLRYWAPVDWYNGGMEHTTLHLLYSRFWYKFLWDIGAVPRDCGPEPYRKRTSHGMILGSNGEKMSKSRGNVVNPDELVQKFGADAVRTYIMFMGPFEQAIPWDTNGLVGVRRFLDKIWRLSETVNDQPLSLEVQQLCHRTIKKVTDDIAALRLNTAVSALMILVNELSAAGSVERSAWESFLKLLAPFAPHLAEELWHQLGHADSVHRSTWPVADPTLLVAEQVEIVVQVNGKRRGSVSAAPDADQTSVESLARAEPAVQAALGGASPTKVIFVPGRLINFVV